MDSGRDDNSKIQKEEWYYRCFACGIYSSGHPEKVEKCPRCGEEVDSSTVSSRVNILSRGPRLTEEKTPRTREEIFRELLRPRKRTPQQEIEEQKRQVRAIKKASPIVQDLYKQASTVEEKWEVLLHYAETVLFARKLDSWLKSELNHFQRLPEEIRRRLRPSRLEDINRFVNLPEVENNATLKVTGPRKRGSVDHTMAFAGLKEKKTDLSPYMFKFKDLTDLQETCIRLRFEYGLPVTQIAKRLGRAKSTIQECLAGAQKKIDHRKNRTLP